MAGRGKLMGTRYSTTAGALPQVRDIRIEKALILAEESPIHPVSGAMDSGCNAGFVSPVQILLRHSVAAIERQFKFY